MTIKRKHNQISDETRKIIKTDDGFQIYVDPDVLIAQSQYFKALFRYDPRQCIHIRDVDSDNIKQLLLYLEAGDLVLNERNILSLLKTADYLMLDGVIKKFQRAICKEISPWNCIAFFNAALFLTHLDILPLCYSYILIHFESVVKYANIGNMSFEHLQRFLTDKDLNVDCEDTVWEAIVLWVEGEKVDRIQRVPSLVRCIRLEACSEACIRKIMNHPFMLGNEISNILENRAFKESNIIQNFIEAVRCSSSESLYLGPRQHVVCSAVYQPVDQDWYLLSEFSILSSEGKIISTIPSVKNDTSGVFWSVYRPEDHSIYVYDTDKSDFSCFSWLKGSWITLSSPPSTFVFVYLSLINARICALLANITGMVVCNFIPELNQWHECHPSYNVFSEILIPGSTISLYNDLVFAVHHDQITLMVLYDTNNKVWKNIQMPNIEVEEITLMAFDETVLKFLNQSTAVEQFYPDAGTWRKFPDLPSAYQFPDVQSLMNTILVFEHFASEEDRRPIYWDRDSQAWRDWTSRYNSPVNYVIDDVDVVRKYHQQLMKEEWESLCRKMLCQSPYE